MVRSWHRSIDCLGVSRVVRVAIHRCSPLNALKSPISRPYPKRRSNSVHHNSFYVTYKIFAINTLIVLIFSVETFLPICFVLSMFSDSEVIEWRALAGPYGQAERALGRLAHALETTPLHSTWLWREMTRVAALLGQHAGYHAKIDQLRLALIGAPLDREDLTPGLAAARRIFLGATPLFRATPKTDSRTNLWPRFWQEEILQGETDADDKDEAGEGRSAERQLDNLVHDLAAFADDGSRPALITLLVDLRQHAATRTLPPSFIRIAFPLALARTGLVPKAAPGLLGGRRLPLGMSRAADLKQPLSLWLAESLKELGKEADQSHRRLLDLTRQHRAWHDALSKLGLRRHARAPKALDLLAATPVVTMGLVARHLGCSQVAAGQVIKLLLDQGIVLEQTSRARHKIFMAGDLAPGQRSAGDPDGPLDISEPLRPLDVDAVEATLKDLYVDLDRVTARSQARLGKIGP